MNRNQFLKLTGLSGVALVTLPHLAFSHRSMSYDELIGKGNPELFGEGFKLRKEAYEAFMNMKNEALKSEIHLKVVSSYRDFNRQNLIWERKFKRYKSQGMTSEATIQKIIEYSTIPGTSRHHWGTDIDIVDANVKQPPNLLNPKNFVNGACFSNLKVWMDTNANHFGFYLVYTDDITRKGFKYEPWHYSYKPLSCQYLSEYRQLNITQILENERIMGIDHFSDEFIKNYMSQNILDISTELL